MKGNQAIIFKTVECEFFSYNNYYLTSEYMVACYMPLAYEIKTMRCIRKQRNWESAKERKRTL